MLYKKVGLSFAVRMHVIVMGCWSSSSIVTYEHHHLLLWMLSWSLAVTPYNNSINITGGFLLYTR